MRENGTTAGAGARRNGRSRRVLITGGAGFIGSHLADALLAQGHRVRVLDNLCPQVHGETDAPPRYLDKRAEFVRGDVRDRDAVHDALEGVDTVYHLAAAVGVGQSMYEIAHYTDVNSGGTGVLLEALRDRSKRIRRLVIASSMSIYGEGLYQDGAGKLVENAQRDEQRARSGDWECRRDGRPLTPLATPESKRPSLASVYALSKYDQEQKCLIFGRAYDVPTVALRFFNAYGPRQALSNPYTGVIAIFASRLLNNKAPVIFEDGHQRRDFVSVYDIADACCRAGLEDGVDGEVLNIGSGESVTVLDIAKALGEVLGRESIEPEISGEYRSGDIRHCFADIERARRVLGYQPRWSLRDGLADLAQWLRDQTAKDSVDTMRDELRRHGLARSENDPDRAQRNAEGNGRVASDGLHLPGHLNGHVAARTVSADVLVTGGCGFVGVNMVKRLVDRGQRVRVLDNFSRAGSRENASLLEETYTDTVEIVEGDVGDSGTVRRAVAGVDRVLHLAAQVAVTCSLDDPVADFRTNAGGTVNLLEALRRYRPEAHLIFASTNKVYGDLAGLSLVRRQTRFAPADPVIERRGYPESSLSFHSPYGCSKGAADQYVLDYARSYGLRTTVCRMSCIYGALQRGTEDQGWVSHFLRTAIQERPITIYGDGRQVRDLLYISDLLDAYDSIWENPEATSGEAFNIGGGPSRAISILELLQRFEALLGREQEVVFAPWRLSDQRYFVSDTSKLQAATGWEARCSIAEGLDQLRDWITDQRAGRAGRPGVGSAPTHARDLS